MLLVLAAKLKAAIEEKDEALSKLGEEKENMTTELNTLRNQQETQGELVKDFQDRLKELQEERDEEKKHRVSFEMRLVEYEDYKKHAETDIVSCVKTVLPTTV